MSSPCSTSSPAPPTTPSRASARGVWTRDFSAAHRLAKKVRAETVRINCYNIFDGALPFGGWKQSGWGREMGQEAINRYTETKPVRPHWRKSLH